MDDRRDAEPRPDEATFAVVRVNRRRGRLPALLVSGAALSVAGLGLLGAAQASRPGSAPAVAAAGPPVPASMRDVAASPVVPIATISPAAAVSPSMLRLHTRAWGPYVYVQADVLTLDAEVVVVSIWSPDERVLDIRSVSIPGGSTAFRLGASDRLQLAFEVEGLAAREVAFVLVNAYDRVGLPIASERQRLHPPVDPGWWRGEGGS